MYKEKGFVGPLTQTYQSRLSELMQLFDSFQDAPPFTLRRLIELVTESSTQYTATHKYMNGLERILSVTSTL